MPHTPDHKGLKGRLKTDRLSASERSRLRTLRRQKKSGSLSGSQLAEFKDLRKQRRKAIGKDLLKAGALVGGAALAAPALAGTGAGAGKLLGAGKALKGAGGLGKIGKAIEGADKLGKLKKAVDVAGDVKEIAGGVKEVTGALSDVKDLVAPQPLMEDMIGEPEPIEPIEPPQIDNTIEGDGLAGLANTFKYGGRVRKKKKKRI